MESGGAASSSSSSSLSSDSSVSGLREKHRQELENLTLLTQPFKTLKFFVLGVFQCVWRSVLFLLDKGGWLLFVSTIVAAVCVLLLTIGGPHEKILDPMRTYLHHVEEILKYVDFGLWWLVLGIASSIGLGSGLHTFVLYLGPHIALFTIKAMQCGRVDLKAAPYDTIQLKRAPSWLNKDCSEFGPPLFTPEHGSQVPLSTILQKIQLEAILWGIGTAIGELPPYFISRAARISGGKLDSMEELDVSSNENTGTIASCLNKVKHQFLSHTQHLNFVTILALASVPNPLFDLAGIMCGQFGIPFWKFFLATLIGKAIIKTHIQTIFIISVCNNQLLDWIENEMIWILGLVPGFGAVLPNIVAELKSVKHKYLKAPANVTANVKVKRWELSFASIWSTVVWLMLINFSLKIVTATAQRCMQKYQEKEMTELKKKIPMSSDPSDS